MSHNIATVISFCSNDWRFLERSIQEAKYFSKQIVIACCDHFFDGTVEDLAFLEECYRKYSDCCFVEYHFDPAQPYGRAAPLALEDLNGVRHWHNTARLVAFYALAPEIETILFLDADEIVEGLRFANWLDQFPYLDFTALRFASYWYFREARFCATTFSDTSLLVNRSSITSEHLLDADERAGYFLRANGNKLQQISLEKPLMHHFSWVRTQEEMIKKTASWGHHWERDWKALIEEEYARAFNGRDFIRQYEYAAVEPLFDPLSLHKPNLPAIDLQTHLDRLPNFPNVQRLTAKEAFRLELALHLKNPF